SVRTSTERSKSSSRFCSNAITSSSVRAGSTFTKRSTSLLPPASRARSSRTPARYARRDARRARGSSPAVPEARLSSSVNDSDAVQFHQRVADNAVFADEGGGRFRTDVIRCKCRRQKDFGRANCSVVLIVYRVARLEISFRSLHVSDLEILEAAGVEPRKTAHHQQFR